MTNRTRAFGQRILGALRNENIVLLTSTVFTKTTLMDAKTQKGFATVSVQPDGYFLHAQDFSKWYGALQYGELVADIKSLPAYPAPKQRKQYGAPRVRHTQTTGVSMGRFVPGLSMGMGE